jgi:hypothetical protein
MVEPILPVVAGENEYGLKKKKNRAAKHKKEKERENGLSPPLAGRNVTIFWPVISLTSSRTCLLSQSRKGRVWLSLK